MKLLIMEDEMGIANFLIRGFRSEGWQVTNLEDGQEGLDLMMKDQFDVIILDLLLPGMSGETFLKELRKRRCSVPVVVLTSIDDSDVKARLLDAGADDFMTKPFSFVELLARVKSVLRRCNGQIKEVDELKVGDLILDLNTRTVKRGKKEIKNLRFKEFSLLEYFMRNPNKVLTHSMITEKVWDYNAHFNSNTLAYHMSLLRNKINKGFIKKHIETIHGVGYILREETSPKRSFDTNSYEGAHY